MATIFAFNARKATMYQKVFFRGFRGQDVENMTVLPGRNTAVRT